MEFALVLPILLLLIMGTIDFARAYNTHISLTAAAREGARHMAIEDDPSCNSSPEGATHVTIQAAPSLNPPLSCSDVAITPSTCTSGDKVTVTAAYSFDYITPISGLLQMFGGSALASPVTITGIGVMRCGG